MPVTPRNWWKRLTNSEAVEKTKETAKKNYLIYSILLIVLIEIISLFICGEDYYQYWYVVLTNLSFAIFTLQLYLLKEKLEYCSYKRIGLFLLFLYFLNGCFSFLVGAENFYYNFVQLFLIIFASIFLFYSFIKLRK